MHGSPWLRASAAIKRQNVEGGWRLGDGSVLIGCVSRDDDIVFYFFNFGFLSGEIVLNRLLRLQHNLSYYPAEILNRAAGILRMRGYMLGNGLRLCRRQIVTPINVFNGAIGKLIRIASRNLGERLLLIPRCVDFDLQVFALRRDEPGLDVAQPPFNVKSR
jgi:hypothetical protein